MTTHDSAPTHSPHRPLDQLRAVRDLVYREGDRKGDPLPASAKLVLLALILRTNAARECWPSYQTIGDDTTLDRRTVQRMVQLLVRNGYLAVRRRRVEGSAENDCNVYTVAALDHHVAADDHHVVAPDHQGGDSTPPPVAVDDHQGGDPMPPDLPSDLPKGNAQVSDSGAVAPEPLSLSPSWGTEMKPKPGATPEHRELVAYYVTLYERLRHCRPDIMAKDHVGANRLLGNGRSLADAKAILDRAFNGEDDFARRVKPDLAFIASNVNAYLGTAPAKAADARRMVQPVPAEGSAWKMGEGS